MNLLKRIGRAWLKGIQEYADLRYGNYISRHPEKILKQILCYENIKENCKKDYFRKYVDDPNRNYTNEQKYEV